MSHTLDYASPLRESASHWLAPIIRQSVPGPARWWGYYMAAAHAIDAGFDAAATVAALRVAPVARAQWTFNAGKDVWQGWVAAEFPERRDSGCGRTLLVSRVLRVAGGPAELSSIDLLPTTYPHPPDPFVQFIEIAAGSSSHAP